ncbi:MAG: tagaturonate reductase, partial [Bacteroidales bacterium]|nr:tagaturonate reductase [Bacteroidales bacterium]
MERLNRTSAPQAKQYTEKIIQFGEGNFLRAFIEWIIWKTNQKTDFNASVVVVQPIEKGMVGWLNEQDGLYHLNLQGLQGGQPVDSVDLIDVVSRGINPYEDFQAYLKLAEQPEMRFVISNTTEAGIAFDPACKLDDAPASSYPGKLTQLLYHRYQCFNGAADKGFIIFPCELIFENGK